MKKLKLVIILFLLLFTQNVYCGHNNTELPFAFQNDREDKSGFETNEFFHYTAGDLPSAQVFFNIIPQASFSTLANKKTKDLCIELFLSKSKINQNLSFHQVSVFSRYCSAFVHIYLKTACFRL